MEEDLYFCFTASLRIFGDIEDMDQITNIVGVQPTKSHRKGEKRTGRSKPYTQDMWCYEPKIDEKENLSKHLNALWAAIGQNAQKIKELKKQYNVDITLHDGRILKLEDLKLEYGKLYSKGNDITSLIKYVEISQ